MTRALLKLLKSLRLTIFLLISLSVIFLLGLVIPQRNLLGGGLFSTWKAARPALVNFLEALGLTSIYTSPLTLALWTLFFLNLLVIMTSRIPLIWRKAFNEDVPRGIDSLRGHGHFEIIEGKGIDETCGILRERGYRVSMGDRSFRAAKNWFSPLATILFHLSFVLLLTGGIISFYTKFTAEAAVAEGETFSGEFSVIQKPKIGSMPSAYFTLEDIRPTYFEKNYPVNLDVVLNSRKGKEVIGINRPYRDGPLYFVIKNIDVAPLFILKDREGREVDGAYVKLKVLDGKEDQFLMAGYKFVVRFYTDFTATGKGPAGIPGNLPQALKQEPGEGRVAQDREIINPAVRIVVYKDNRLITAGVIRHGESLDFDGYGLTLSGLAYWAKFYIVGEHGLWVIYAGFALMTIALVVRFIFFRRDILGILEDGKLYIAGRGEFYPSLFDEEFRRIVAVMKS